MPAFRQVADGASGNAESKAETTAQGSNTHGIVNRHPGSSRPAGSPRNAPWPFRVGVSEDRNKRWRRTMEDAHAFVYDFGGVHGQGFFSIFDGHAGKHAAEWCGKHFHEYLIATLISNGRQPVPDLLNMAFHSVDTTLSELASTEGTSSGCTAVTCFLRLEDEEGRPVAHAATGGIDPSSHRRLSGYGGAARPSSDDEHHSKDTHLSSLHGDAEGLKSHSSSGSGSGSGLFSSFAKRIRKASSGGEVDVSGKSSPTSSPSSGSSRKDKRSSAAEAVQGKDGLVRNSGGKARRVLYTANVGDARAVLCRRGHAVRLTYDHKASDAQEAKRITDAGGFVMNNRVNAVLAVTRSLGDSAMKEFVVGAPYTTETTLTDEDSFLIVACDGLWDVVDDQDAVDLIRDIRDPQEASQHLLQHALSNFSTDNTSVMVVKFLLDGNALIGKSGAGAAETRAVAAPEHVSSRSVSSSSDRRHGDETLSTTSNAGSSASDATDSGKRQVLGSAMTGSPQGVSTAKTVPRKSAEGASVPRAA